MLLRYPVDRRLFITAETLPIRHNQVQSCQPFRGVGRNPAYNSELDSMPSPSLFILESQSLHSLV